MDKDTLILLDWFSSYKFNLASANPKVEEKVILYTNLY